MDQHERKSPVSFRLRRQPNHESSRDILNNSKETTTMRRSTSMSMRSAASSGSGTFTIDSSDRRSTKSSRDMLSTSEHNNSSAFKSHRDLLTTSDHSNSFVFIKSPAFNPRIQELTINKLKYDALGLVGRDKEVTILKERCDRALNDTIKELIVIKGTSGLGKSSLTKTVEEQISGSDRGIVGRGKFNLESGTQPYSGLVDALNQLYQDALVTDGETEQMKKQLALELGDDRTLLAALIPALETLAPADFLLAQRSVLVQELYNPDAEQAKWKNAFKVFIRVLCQHCSPLVIILDDLQWADRSSLGVIEDLLSDPFNKESLMIIGTFRSDEVDPEDTLSTVLQTLEKKKKKFHFDMTHIEPKNLDADGVHEIIMALLGMDDKDATRGLAKTCFKRTLGNPNFVVQFIAMLEEEQLISFNLGLLKWVWDDRAIEDGTMSTENVVDLLQLRMKKLSSDLRLLMQYAACLGSTFDPSVLALLWEKHGSSTRDLNVTEEDPTMALLVKLEKGNFVEHEDGEYYRWVHDKVQEAALDMEEAQRSSFYFEVGFTLLNDLPDDKLELLLFVVTNLINKSNVHGRLEFAQLNLRAAEKAQRLSAFYSGAKYAAKTIEMLPNERWNEHRELALNAYTMGAEMEVATGNVEIAEEYCDVILKRDDYTALEKFRLYMVKINILCFVNVRYREAIDFSLEVLKEFDCKLVHTRLLLPVHAIRSVQKTIKLAKKTTKAEYQALKPSDNVKLEATMTILGRMNYACAQLPSPLLLALSTTKMVNMTLEHGLFSFSGAAQCILGMVSLAALGDVQSATYFAETGALMQKSIPSTHFLATTVLVSHQLILPWSSPLAICRPKLLEGYTEGMRTGNLSDGIWCLVAHTLFMPIQMGMRLQTIDSNMQMHIRVIEDLKQSNHVDFIRLFVQILSDLIGESDQSTVMSTNSVFSDEDGIKAKNRRAVLSLANYILMVYSSDFEEAAKLSLTKGGVYQNHFKMDSMGAYESFLRGVALFAMARKTKKRRYRNPAAKVLKYIAKLRKEGNPNVQPYFTLLSAEQAALNKDTGRAKKLYQETIVYAAKTGQLNHAALSNERYSDFLLNELHDSQEAKYRMDEAIRFYEDWGAYAKADRLKGLSIF
ncbi:unnamed protein product [Cylindrotheca closterium]|uniref:Orc1-like AAA ATPase domain-containing protein n=1 Tax=Cylindrotheca closterium TaxID=2856 RepID=A0AAD2CPW9_9STRA|nr:unnamed protein product [Cylindrotheca closterium]